jgi:hypothetical protein
MRKNFLIPLFAAAFIFCGAQAWAEEGDDMGDAAAAAEALSSQTGTPAPAQAQPPAEAAPDIMTATPAPPPEMEDMDVAVLRTIDKISARRHTFDIPVGKTVQFGNSLFIKVQACRQSSPLSQPESAAFLQIWERPPQEAKSRWVFSGWMFASSPSLSRMDHPVYDVWVIDCKNKAASAKDESFSKEKAPEEKPETSAPAAADAPAADKPASSAP